MVRFDGYSATTASAGRDDLMSLLLEPGDEVRSGRGFHTFGERHAVVDPTGDPVGAVMCGGRQGDRVMLEVKGERSPRVVEALRERFDHRCTRLDSCVDFERPGAFLELLEPVLKVKEQFRLYGERRGDWDFPELGRTQMLGASSSAIRLRLYEKGKQPEYRHLARPDLVRAEIQIRPAKDAKDAYARVTPVEAWGASKWTRALSAELLGELLDPVPPGTVRKFSTREKALRWMVKQYGPHLVGLAADLGGWDVLGLTLQEMLKEENSRGNAH